MTKVTQKAALALAACAVALSAHADCNRYQCDNVQVVAHYIDANGDALVQLSGKPWKLACKPTRYVYIKLPRSTPGFENTYAHLAASKIMERAVTVQVDLDAQQCTVERIVGDVQ